MSNEERLAANEWGHVVKNGRVLELRWLDALPMTDAAFMATLCLFASTAEKERPEGLLIDATKFRHTFGSGITEWRHANIVPRYGAAGVRRLAFHMPAGFPKAGAEEVDGPAVFPTRWFVDRRAAFAWLNVT
jgi:hypothetical protein